MGEPSHDAQFDLDSDRAFLGFSMEPPWRSLVGAPDDAPIDSFKHRVELGADLCVIEERIFLIRGLIEIPILGTDKAFSWGVWCSLSEESFDHLTERWNHPERHLDPPRFGWLMSDLPGYEGGTIHLKTMVHQREPGVTPRVEVEPVTPLGLEQANGMTVTRWRELVRLAMNYVPIGIPKRVCACCGKPMTDLPAITYRRPDEVNELPPKLRTRMYETDDVCAAYPERPPMWRRILHSVGVWPYRSAWAPPFFLRAVLTLPRQEHANEVGLEYGPWVRVERDGYLATVGQKQGERLAPFRGTLANELVGFRGSRGLEVEVDPGDGTHRPMLRVVERGELHKLQTDGISDLRANSIVSEFEGLYDA